VSREAEDLNRRLLRARDAMDRAYAEPLDVRAVGETPSAYRMGNGPIVAPHCVQLAAMRPRSATTPARD
jgi:hypothetical protein